MAIGKADDAACALQIERRSERPVCEVGQSAGEQDAKLAEIVVATLDETSAFVIHCE